MSRIRKSTENIRAFVLENVKDHPNDIAQLTAKKFDISRQAVNVHIRSLIAQEAILNEGNNRIPHYSLKPKKIFQTSYSLANLQEDIVWRKDILPKLGSLPENVIDIWHYGITEMINNAIDHSEGQSVEIQITKTAIDTSIFVIDDGEGIFKRITRILQLTDERHAVLELAKGKLTTDPANHTGEGIFFSSRAFDLFYILSGSTNFSHSEESPEDWIIESIHKFDGTNVYLQMKNNSSKELKQVFDKYTSDDEYGFNKTIVPVSLIRYGNENLVSRSQAKRLLSGVDRFKIVILDFKDVDRIGQAFADEIFRVFRKRNPHINLYFINANEYTNDIIIRSIRDTRPDQKNLFD